jgi:hypothetical protein
MHPSDEVDNLNSPWMMAIMMKITPDKILSISPMLAENLNFIRAFLFKVGLQTYI